jgi:hypothetical protein
VHDDEESESPDVDLLASMISTAVIPRTCATVEGGAFDVYSERHVKRMVDLTEEIEASVGKNDKFQVRPVSPATDQLAHSSEVQTLLKSVVKIFRTVITETEALVAEYTSRSRPTTSFNPEAIPARRRFLARRVKLLKNLLRWRKYTGDKFGEGLLVERLVEGCVLGVAEGGWEIGGEEIVRKVCIPRLAEETV